MASSGNHVPARPGRRLACAAATVLTLLAVVSSNVTASPAHAADPLSVEGFESGSLAGWTVTGDVSIVGQEGPIAPYGGGKMLRMSTGGSAVSGTSSSMTRSVVIPPQILAQGGTFSLRYNLVSEEYPEYVNTQYNDTAKADMHLSNGTTINIFTASVNADSFAPVSGIDYPGGDSTVGQTGWKTATVKLTAEQLVGVTSGTWSISDYADAAYDSVLLLDEVRLFVGEAYDCDADPQDDFTKAQLDELLNSSQQSGFITAEERTSFAANPCRLADANAARLSAAESAYTEQTNALSGCRNATARLPYYSLPLNKGKIGELSHEVQWCWKSGQILKPKTNDYGPRGAVTEWGGRAGISFVQGSVKKTGSGYEPGPSGIADGRYRSQSQGILHQKAFGLDQDIKTLNLTILVTGDGSASCSPSTNCTISVTDVIPLPQ
jgi:hypothetical protein